LGVERAQKGKEKIKGELRAGKGGRKKEKE
jgi:hypothetical protein